MRRADVPVLASVLRRLFAPMEREVGLRRRERAVVAYRRESDQAWSDLCDMNWTTWEEPGDKTRHGSHGADEVISYAISVWEV